MYNVFLELASSCVLIRVVKSGKPNTIIVIGSKQAKGEKTFATSSVTFLRNNLSLICILQNNGRKVLSMSKKMVPWKLIKNGGENCLK